MKRECFVIRGGEPLFGKVTLHGAKKRRASHARGGSHDARTRDGVRLPGHNRCHGYALRPRRARSKGGARRQKNHRQRFAHSHGDSSRTGLRDAFLRVHAGRAHRRVRGSQAVYTGRVQDSARPLDIHFDGFSRLGVGVEYGEDYVLCTAKKLRGADIVMKYPSVGATENLLMAAVRAEGVTRLIGAAREPEITSLVRLLRRMGAQITGEGTPVLTVRGVDSLDGAEITPISDRIVAGTVMAGVAVCGGRVELENAVSSTLGAVISPFLGSHTFWWSTAGC